MGICRRPHRLWLMVPFLALAAAAPAGDGPNEPDLSFLADNFRKHCVQVALHCQSDDGDVPATGDFAADIRGERSTLVGGYWWDERHVVIADPVIQDRFIRRIEIGLPFSEQRFPARIAGRFVKLFAILLEVLPGPDGELPRAFPLEFIDNDPWEAVLLGYAWDNGRWRVAGGPGVRARSFADDGTVTARFGGEGVLVDEAGRAVGLAFGGEAAVEEQPYWYGSGTAASAFITAERTLATGDALSRRLRSAVLEVRLRVRLEVDDDEDDVRIWATDDENGPYREGMADVLAAGWVVGERHVLIPLAMTPEGIARLEEITVTLPNGETLPARFMGAFREYLAILAETDGTLPTADLPPGFTRLNPLVVSEEAFLADSHMPERPEQSLFRRVHIDYSLGRRREIHEYDRWLGTHRGYRSDEVVTTRTNEADGSLAFDADGNLAAAALTPRALGGAREGYGLTSRAAVAAAPATPGFRPVDFLDDAFHAGLAFDPAIRPVDGELGQRLIDFGAEFQALDANTARLFASSQATRGGAIGLLVTHVYPDSAAERAGVREQDILLRLRLEGRNEPMELRTSGYQMYQAYFDREDMSAESLAMMFGYMGPPWPSRDDVIAAILTAAGPGRQATMEFLREGEALRAEFVTAYAPPDYRSARKERFSRLGLTVKPVTYEVQRFYRRPDAGGVVVSRVEEGGRASVAGLHRYLLVVQVDGVPVADVDDFRARLSRFESGEAESVELMVDIFGKTRLIKIS